MKHARVRIIGGQWKRTPLVVPGVPGLRPTPDRVRETLFNWLGQDLSGWHCLDAFAGSGALGFEAASRGASRVVMIESDRRVFEELCSLRTRLQADQVDLRLGDALTQMDRIAADAHAAGDPAEARFDLIFLDPPFGQGWLKRVLPRAWSILKPGGRLYVEAEAPLVPGGSEWPALPDGGHDLTLLRSAKAGQVHYHLLGG